MRASSSIRPRRALPTLASVTVVSDRCLLADGWDTPLLVLGPQRGYECAKEHDIAALFIARGANGEQTQATPAWIKRFGSPK